MSEHPLKKKSSLIMFGLFMAGVSANNLRYTKNVAYGDPYCNTWSADGLCCLKCSNHYFMNANGRCQAVSDWCKTWDDKTGCCTSCFDGYGVPVNGVCSSVPVGSGGNDCNNGGNVGGNNSELPTCEEQPVVNSNDDSGRVDANTGSQVRIIAQKYEDESRSRQSCSEEKKSGEYCSNEVSEEKPSDCESGDEWKVKRWRRKFGSKNKRNHSRKSRNAWRSKKFKDCSEEKVTDSCKESYSGAQHYGKWGKIDRWGYKHNGNFGHKFAGKFAEKWSQRKERESRWFSKKFCHDGECKVQKCSDEKWSGEYKEHSCSKKSGKSCSKSVRSCSKSVRSCSKSVRSCSKSVRSCSKSVRSCSKSVRSCSKSVRSCSKSVRKKSHHSKKNECRSLSKKSHRSCSKKSYHSKKVCESPSKKSCRSLSKKSNYSRKSKRSERKSRFEGLSKRRVELKSKHECGSKKCCEKKECCSVKKDCSMEKKSCQKRSCSKKSCLLQKKEAC